MDSFKMVVDTHGHLLGAKVLREVANVVHAQLGENDRIVRYGGDEYVVLLPGQHRDQAMATTQRLREAISLTPFLQAEEIGLHATASFGVATFPDDAVDKKQLLLAADQCLFRSKREGKNRVSASTPSTTELAEVAVHRVRHAPSRRVLQLAVNTAVRVSGQVG